MRLRKSFKVGPVRLNVSSRGVGASMGVKGARVGVNSRGVYTSASAFGLSSGPQYLSSGRSRSRGPSLAAIERAANDAERERTYNALVAELTSIHRGCDAKLIRWAEIAVAPDPEPPAPSSKHEDAALQRLVDYQPGRLANFFGNTERRRAELERAVQHAAQLDAEEHGERMGEYDAALAAAQATRDHAARVVAVDIEAWKHVVGELGTMGTISSLGSELAFRFVREDDAPAGAVHMRVGVTVRVHSSAVIPDYTVGRTPTGRLSTKKLSKTDYHALHQDYVCGCALRVARETLNLLPTGAVVVTCTDEAFDSATGHDQERTLLSVKVTRRELDSINLMTCDPSDAVTTMEHRMTYHKTQGFRTVEPLPL